MSYNIEATTAKLLDQERQLSFESFAGENGFPISVFEDLKFRASNPFDERNKTKIGELLAAQKARQTEMYEAYKKFLAEKHHREQKKFLVELGIKFAENRLIEMVHAEQRKLDFSIHRAKLKYGADNAKHMIRTAEVKANDILNFGKGKAYDLAADIRKMARTESIPDIISYAAPTIFKLAKNGKHEYRAVVKKLDNGEFEKED